VLDPPAIEVKPQAVGCVVEKLECLQVFQIVQGEHHISEIVNHSLHFYLNPPKFSPLGKCRYVHFFLVYGVRASLLNRELRLGMKVVLVSDHWPSQCGHFHDADHSTFVPLETVIKLDEISDVERILLTPQ